MSSLAAAVRRVVRYLRGVPWDLADLSDNEYRMATMFDFIPRGRTIESQLSREHPDIHSSNDR